MKTNTKTLIVSHVVTLMTGVAIATALFYREDPYANQHPPMFTYEEADEDCGCTDSLDANTLKDVDTLWTEYKPAKR